MWVAAAVPLLQACLAVTAAGCLAAYAAGRTRRVDPTAAGLLWLAVTLLSALSVAGALLMSYGRTRLQQQNRRLHDQAFTDALTGLGNRRDFDERLQAAWTESVDRRDTLSLLIVDVDHFKAFNDVFGHLEGDRVLRQLGDALRGSAVRFSDRAYRFGGEEFALVLPATNAAGASKVAGELRRLVAGLRIEHPASHTGILTVSIGIAQAIPARHPDGCEQLMQVADNALYEAKRDGRDKVKVGIWTGSTDQEWGGGGLRVDGCEIIMANGRKVRIPGTLDAAMLASILQAVGSDE
jgi:diguanylate cyclase (GGDEF)-like protein